MAGTVYFGGATSTGTFTDNWIQSINISMVVGRTAANGQGPILITGIYPYMSGRGAGRNANISLGAASTGWFYVPAGGNGNIGQGWKSVSNGLVANGGLRTYFVDVDGSMWFSRDNVGSGITSDSYGTGFTGTLQGQYSWVESPNAPTGVTAVNNPGTGVLVSWTTPSDTGGTPITGYRIEYATDSGFTTGVGTVNVGVVNSYNFTTLTSGVTYWFRVYAKNAVTDAAGTTSVASTSTSVAAGYWTYSGSASMRVLITNAGTYPTSVSFSIEHSIDVSDLTLGNTYSASIVTFFAPASGVAHPTPLKINPSLVWQNSLGVTLATYTLTSVETYSGQNTFTFSGMVMPAGATTAKIIISVPAANNYSSANLYVNDQFYADAALLTNGVIVPYFDGNLGGTYAWSGAADNSRSYNTATATPLYDAYDDDNAIYSVRAGEVATFTIDTNTYPVSIQQPAASDTYPALPGTYVVSAADNLIVPAAEWIAYGGGLVVQIGTEPGTYVLTLTGPTADIPGAEGPYTLSVSDDENNYATFSILGNGVITDPVTRRFSTGASPTKTTNEVALTFDSPFVSSLQDAVDAAALLMIDAAGPIITFNGTVSPDGLGSFSKAGALTETHNSIYRHQSINITRREARLTGRPYVKADKIESIWNGLTAADFDDFWSGKTAGDFMVEPLRKP